jgi:hypothetical protein
MARKTAIPGMSEAGLAEIERRAELQFRYGVPEALPAEDVAALVNEIRDLWSVRDRLMALNRQHLQAVPDQP